MAYKITIEKIETLTVTRQGAWVVIDKRPWNGVELDEKTSYRQGGFEEFLKDNPLKEVMGYAPNISAQETKETVVLEQTVEALNIRAVINAINAPPRKPRTPKAKA